MKIIFIYVILFFKFLKWRIVNHDTFFFTSIYFILFSLKSMVKFTCKHSDTDTLLIWVRGLKATLILGWGLGSKVLILCRMYKYYTGLGQNCQPIHKYSCQFGQVLYIFISLKTHTCKPSTNCKDLKYGTIFYGMAELNYDLGFNNIKPHHAS